MVLNATASRSQQWIVIIAAVLGAAILGALVPIYAGIMGENAVRLMALPALLVLALLLVFSPTALFLLILLFRAGTDHVFEASRVSILGYTTGIGGLLNAFIVLVVLVLIAQRPGLLPKKHVHSWAPFLITSAIGVAIAPSKPDAIRIYVTFLTYFSVFMGAFYVIRSPYDWRKGVRLVLWASLLPASYALIDIGLNVRATGLGVFRLESTFTHPNILAFFITLTLTLILYVQKSTMLAGAPAKRFWLGLYAFYLLSLLVLTQTRAAWVACAAVFAVYGLVVERRYLAYIAAASGLAILLPPVQERLLDLTQGNEYVQYAQLNSFAWRRILWESALQWMEPLRYGFGYGAQSFPHHAQSFFPLAGATTPGAHNVYVQWLFEFGAAGLLALLWLFYRIVCALWAIRGVDRMAAFATIMLIGAYLISSFSDNMMGYLAFSWYFWFILGAALAAFSPSPSGVAVDGGRAHA